MLISDIKRICNRRGDNPYLVAARAIEIAAQLYQAHEAAATNPLAHEAREFLRPYRAYLTKGGSPREQSQHVCTTTEV